MNTRFFFGEVLLINENWKKKKKNSLLLNSRTSSKALYMYPKGGGEELPHELL